MVRQEQASSEASEDMETLSTAADTAVTRELDRMRADRTTPALLHGVLVGIAASEGRMSRAEASEVVSSRLAPGADPELVADFLLGLLQAAPDVLLRDQDLIEAVSAALGGLSDEAFLSVLPDLRKAFTFLKPTDTHHLATQIARLTGVQASSIDVVFSIDPALAERAQRMEQALVAGLVRDGLIRDGQPVAP